MPNGPRGPYSVSRVSPATIVGSAKGRSMIALTIALPGKRSRTRTQAISVPDHRVDRGHDERHAERELERGQRLGLVTTSQKPPTGRPRRALATTAASGSSTITLR